jgi:hypothetical protein
MITCVAAGAGLLAGILSMFLSWRHRSAQRVGSERLRMEMERRHEECLRQLGRVTEEFATSERAAHSSMELLSGGRLAIPARTRALRMLRSGKAADTTAIELGLGRREVELLAKVATLLSVNN